MGIIIRQSIKGTIVNLAGAFIGFLITFFIITQFLDASDIGLINVLLEAATLLSSLAMLGVSSSAIRFFPYFKTEDGSNRGFFFYLMIMPLIGSLIFVPIFYFLREPISSYFSTNAELFVDYFDWIVPLMFFILYWTTFEIYTSIYMRVVIPRVIRDIGLRVMMLIVYLLYAFKVITLTGFITGFVTVYGIAMFLAFLYMRRVAPVSLSHSSAEFPSGVKRKGLNYTLYYVVGALGSNIISRIDLFMVSGDLGLDFAGIYRIAFFIAAIIEIPTRSIMPMASPIAAEAVKQNDTTKVSKIFKQVSLHQLIASGMAFAIIWINIDSLFHIIPNGAIYIQGKYVVLFLGLAKVIEATFLFSSRVLSYSKYYYYSLYFTFFVSAVTIASNYLLIPIWGITGAAVATMITCIITFGIQQMLIVWKIKTHPFCMGTLKMLVILSLTIGIYEIIPTFNNIWIDIPLRTSTASIILLFTTYKWHVSDEVNGIIDTLYSKAKDLIKKR